MFRVGQKVVCVDAKPRLELGNLPTLLTEGQVYTIATIGTYWGGACGVTLQEITMPAMGNYRYKSGWPVDRFRPAVERKTDISVFKALLKTKKIEESENA